MSALNTFKCQNVVYVSCFFVQTTSTLSLTEVNIYVSASTPVILTEVFRSFPQSLQANAGIVFYIRPQPLPSTSYLINHSFIPSLGAI
jgi:hypothetical protein